MINNLVVTEIYLTKVIQSHIQFFMVIIVYKISALFVFCNRANYNYQWNVMIYCSQLKNYNSCQISVYQLPLLLLWRIKQWKQLTIKKISKKTPSIDLLLAHINNTTANNWDREYVEDTLHELRVKGVIDEHFKILSTDNTIISGNNKTGALPGHPLTPMSAKSASTQTQTTPVSPISNEQPTDFIVNDTKDEQIYNLNAEVKALKSFIAE